MLESLDITIVDCQTNGATPPASQMIELGWARCHALQPSITAEAHLIALKPEQAYPNRIAMLTGISASELAAAGSEAEILGKFLSSIPAKPVLIAHYARFEKTFIEPLLPPDFAHTFLCTYEIARRLYPDLPSRSIRAVSGYLGHHADEAKRSVHHIDATFFIWKRLATELTNRGILTIAGLTDWLSLPPPKASKKQYALSADIRLKMPNKPGIYKMLGHDGRVLYVGKATSLRSRVNSYFRGQKTKGSRLNELVSQIASIDYQITSNAAEAALVESDAIKNLNPPYNRAQRAGNRSIGFAASDMQPFSDRAGAASDKKLFGPFGSFRHLEQLHQIRVAVDLSLDDGDISHLKDIGAEESVIAQGLKLFRTSYAELKGGAVDWRRTLCKSWAESVEQERERRRLAAEEPLDDDSNHDEDEQETEEIVWTPEVVARYVAGAFTSYARSMHRARWLNNLSTCALSWTDEASGKTHHILVDDGRCLFNATDFPAFANATAGLPISDLATYDRMQVLMGEIRRLLREGHALELRLLNGRTLTADQVKRYAFPGEFDAANSPHGECSP